MVVDKDNCLTLPEEDGLYPPLQVSHRHLYAGG